MVAPRKYPEELRERSIRMTLEARQDPAARSGACRRIGEQLGINPETLRGWVTQAEIDASGRPGTTAAEAARLVELEREVRELRRANSITPGRVASGPDEDGTCWYRQTARAGRTSLRGPSRDIGPSRRGQRK